MKNYADERLIKKVQKRLLKQLKKEYRGDGLFVEVEKFEVYMADGPKANLEIRCGRFNNDEANDWQHKIELPITDGLGTKYRRIAQTETSKNYLFLYKYYDIILV